MITKEKHKNYYEELNDAIIMYEQNLPYKRYKLGWISDRITWCNRFKKITEDQTNELCDRMCKVFECKLYEYEDMLR